MLGLGYEVEFFSELSDQFDSIVIVGENLTKSCYPSFVEPYLDAIKTLEEVNLLKKFLWYAFLALAIMSMQSLSTIFILDKHFF